MSSLWASFWLPVEWYLSSKGKLSKREKENQAKAVYIVLYELDLKAMDSICQVSHSNATELRAQK